MVRERGGTPFRQIFWSRNGAPANIVGHRWNANTAALRQITSYSLAWPSISLFSGPICPQTRDLASKTSKNSPAPTPSTHTRRARGRKLPRCWDIGLGNGSSKSKFTTTPLDSSSGLGVCDDPDGAQQLEDGIDEVLVSGRDALDACRRHRGHRQVVQVRVELQPHTRCCLTTQPNDWKQKGEIRQHICKPR